MTLHTNLSFETATGSIDYPFTNDYMFRAILQKDKQVLKALIAALLHLKKESIHDVAITNPIELGAAISDKEAGEIAALAGYMENYRKVIN